LRIVLSWKSNVDLDAHLTGPDNAMGGFTYIMPKRDFTMILTLTPPVGPRATT
jgi:uncharacterized protein YfaP (DUF2135 family)